MSDRMIQTGLEGGLVVLLGMMISIPLLMKIHKTTFTEAFSHKYFSYYLGASMLCLFILKAVIITSFR